MAARPAPHIVHVQTRPPRSPWRAAALLILPAIVIAEELVTGSLGSTWLFLLLLTLGVALPWLQAIRDSRHREAWEDRMRVRFDEWEAEPLAALANRRIKAGVERSLEERARAACAEMPPACSEHAHVFVGHGVDVPDRLPSLFEPMILTTTQRLWSERYVLWVVLGLLTLLAIGRAFPLLPLPLRNIEWVAVLGVLLIVGWGLATLLLPKYIRIAPGVVQVMTYRPGRSKPKIRSYPIDAAARIIIEYTSGPPSYGFRAILRRGEHRDVLRIAGARRPDEVARHFWSAVLSTAPTPPLSDEELVG